MQLITYKGADVVALFTVGRHHNLAHEGVAGLQEQRLGEHYTYLLLMLSQCKWLPVNNFIGLVNIYSIPYYTIPPYYTHLVPVGEGGEGRCGEPDSLCGSGKHNIEP